MVELPLIQGNEAEEPSMSKHAKSPDNNENAAIVLSKAVVRACERLSINGTELAKILGVSQPTASRLCRGEYKLSPGSKEWEFALLLVRIYRSLDSIVGNDETAKRWMRSENLGLNGVPLNLISQTEGIVRVSHYLDAARGIN
jgi:hypothetical protein